MLILIEERKEIEKSQHELEATIRREFNSKTIRNIGFQGGTKPNERVFINKENEYWYSSFAMARPSSPSPRYLNWFGLCKEKGNLHISVEINIPHEGQNKRVSGFFARDTDTGIIYLMHSGGVAGGGKGVGKKGFLIWISPERLHEIASSGGIWRGILVMPIEGNAATKSAIRYIDAVNDFKKEVKLNAGYFSTSEFQKKKEEFANYYSEPAGRRRGKRAENFDYLSRHGEIVDALYGWRNARGLPENGRLVKNVLIDMGIEVDSKLIEVFEVKTSVTRYNFYTAIGQLMVHGKSDKCRKVMVLPQDAWLESDLEESLRRLNIELLRFKLDTEKAIIIKTEIK